MPHTTTLAPKPLHVGPQGRVVIPAEYRRALGVEAGDTLVLWLEGDRLILRRRQSVEEDLWRLMAEISGSLADELLTERREEAKREAPR
ncbi:MAG: AbrB/MazE/SpoVT family DNA-binding domain-containing protein [Gammaproteobacteria bacterium]